MSLEVKRSGDSSSRREKLAKKKGLNISLNLDLKEVYKDLCPDCRRKLLALAAKAGALQALEAQVRPLLEKQLKT